MNKTELRSALFMVWSTGDRQGAIDLGWRWWCHEFLSLEDLIEFVDELHLTTNNEEEFKLTAKWLADLKKTEVLDYEVEVCKSK